MNITSVDYRIDSFTNEAFLYQSVKRRRSQMWDLDQVVLFLMSLENKE